MYMVLYVYTVASFHLHLFMQLHTTNGPLLKCPKSSQVTHDCHEGMHVQLHMYSYIHVHVCTCVCQYMYMCVHPIPSDLMCSQSVPLKKGCAFTSSTLSPTLTFTSHSRLQSRCGGGQLYSTRTCSKYSVHVHVHSSLPPPQPLPLSTRHVVRCTCTCTCTCTVHIHVHVHVHACTCI